MTVVAEVAKVVLYVIVAVNVAVGGWAVGVAVAGRWLDRRERRRVIREFELILDITERVRDTSPPMTPERLAECVSTGCEHSKEMGL